MKMIARVFTSKAYSVLGVLPSSSLTQIKSAYYRLAKEYHPDLNNENNEKFKTINQAYSELKRTHAQTTAAQKGQRTDLWKREWTGRFRETENISMRESYREFSEPKGVEDNEGFAEKIVVGGLLLLVGVWGYLHTKRLSQEGETAIVGEEEGQNHN